MKLKVKERFFDLKDQKLRIPGDEFVTDKERGEELLSHVKNLVEEVKGATKSKKVGG